MYEKSVIHRIARWGVEAFFYMGIVCTAAVPFVTDDVMRFFKYGEGNEAVYAVTLFLSGLLAVYILFNLKKMYKTLLVGDPFIDDNVCAFRRMAVAGLGICIIYVVKSVLVFTVGSVVIALIFAIACLFCLTLKDLFKQAINYKTENELTI